jgi:hypothetical protein
MPNSSATQAAIVRAADEAGVDPAYALAIAQRESMFDPNARASKTIYGVYQMRGDLRKQYGAGDSNDPYTQAKGWMRFQQGVRDDMAKTMGRDPTDEEAYMGHYFGAGRAARMISQYDPSTPVSDVFTPYERKINPEFDRAGTIGPLMSGVSSDVARRKVAFGGGSEQFDSSLYGEPIEPLTQTPGAGRSSGPPEPAIPNFAQYGTPVAGADTQATAA